MIRQIFIGAALMFAGVTVDEKTLVPLGSCAAVGVGVWWMGRKLQALEDGQGSIQRRLDTLLEMADDQLNRINSAV